jgi:hypothetical protein
MTRDPSVRRHDHDEDAQTLLYEYDSRVVRKNHWIQARDELLADIQNHDDQKHHKQ